MLGVTGSIAAYKAVEIARLMIKRGAQVQAVLTDGASRFITEMTFEAITGRPVRRSVWALSGDERRQIDHVEDGYRAERVIVAPASANFLARYAHGFADDALTATLLSTTAQVLVAPAMETRMWRHASTQANVDLLRSRGVQILGPQTGDLASGRSGEGRMWAPERIVDAVLRPVRSPDLSGLKVLLTAGPTWESIDPVRVLTNRSTGAMGLALADAAARRGADVRLVLGPTHLAPENEAVRTIRVESAEQMLAAAAAHLDGTDVFIATAAVSDYRPAQARAAKLKRSDPAATRLELAENPDVLATLAERLRRSTKRSTVVGFAAETENLIQHADAKRLKKGCDLVIANKVGPQHGFGAQQTQVVAVGPDGGATPFGPADKAAVAEFVLDQVVKLRGEQAGS